LNDNTFTEEGSLAMAEVLPNLQELRVINFGDCLVRSDGAREIAEAIKEGHKLLEVGVFTTGGGCVHYWWWVCPLLVAGVSTTGGGHLCCHGTNCFQNPETDAVPAWAYIAEMYMYIC